MYGSPNAVLKGINGKFAIDLAQSLPANLEGAYDVNPNSQVDSEDYLFFDVLPGVQEWKDSIGFSGWKDFDYSLKNKDWYGGAVKVRRNTLSDSLKYLPGNVMQHVKTSAAMFIAFKDELGYTLLHDNGNAFDGTALFANDRTAIKGSAAIDNLISATGQTLATINTDLGSAMTQMLGLKDRNGRPFNPNPSYLVLCPPQLFNIFLQLSQNEFIYNGSSMVSNTYKGLIEVKVISYQSTSDNDWYLVNKASPVKPLIYQIREAPTWQYHDDNRSLYLEYWAQARLNGGYGNPMSIIKVDA